MINQAQSQVVKTKRCRNCVKRRRCARCIRRRGRPCHHCRHRTKYLLRQGCLRCARSHLRTCTPYRVRAPLPQPAHHEHLPRVADWDPQLHGLDTYKAVHPLSDGHNPICCITSQSCSVARSDVPNLCRWHRHRMGHMVPMRCDCREFTVVSGDSPGRRMAREYYELVYEDTPTLDSAGFSYCCGTAQNTDNQTHMCGSMNVCPDHLHLHKPNKLVKIDRALDGDGDEGWSVYVM